MVNQNFSFSNISIRHRECKHVCFAIFEAFFGADLPPEGKQVVINGCPIFRMRTNQFRRRWKSARGFIENENSKFFIERIFFCPRSEREGKSWFILQSGCGFEKKKKKSKAIRKRMFNFVFISTLSADPLTRNHLIIDGFDVEESDENVPRRFQLFDASWNRS